jgi:hypothetical protein
VSRPAGAGGGRRADQGEPKGDDWPTPLAGVRPLPAAPLLFAFAVAMAATLPLFLFFATERFSMLARLLAWLGFFAALLPTLWLLTRRSARVSTVVVAGIWTAVFFHLAVFHEERLLLRWGEARISEASVDVAMLLAALATPAIYLGWHLAGALNLGRALPHPRLDVPALPMRLVGTAIVLMSLLADVLWMRNELTVYQPAVSVIAVLTPSDLGFAMVLVPTLRRERSAGRLLFWGLFAGAALIALMRGVLTPLMKPLLIYVLANLVICRRPRIWPVLVAAVTVVLLQPVKAEFRARVWDRQVQTSLGDRVMLFLDLTAQHWLGGELQRSVDKEQSVKVAAARTAAALQLANAVELTPQAIPHQGGATYRYLRYALIPRVFYPDKPIAQYADVWAAVLYGYTTQSGTAHVMVGLSQVAEAYINFGVLGGLGLLLVLGVLLRIMDEIFAHPRAGTGALALHLYFSLSVAVTLEGSLAQFWGGVLQSYLVYAVALALLGSIARARRGAASPGRRPVPGALARGVLPDRR